MNELQAFQDLRPRLVGVAYSMLGTLALAEEGTRIADGATGVPDEVWAEAREQFDDDQMAALIAVIAMINAYNRFNVIAEIPGGSYEVGMFG